MAPIDPGRAVCVPDRLCQTHIPDVLINRTSTVYSTDGNNNDWLGFHLCRYRASPHQWPNLDNSGGQCGGHDFNSDP